MMNMLVGSLLLVLGARLLYTGRAYAAWVIPGTLALAWAWTRSAT